MPKGLDRRTRRTKPTERMSRALRRQYLRQRLEEIDQLIDVNLRRYLRDLTAAGSAWQSERAELWEDVLHLNYLEANRQAILQSLIDLNTPAYASALPSAGEDEDDIIEETDEGAAFRGSGTYS